MLWDHTFYYAYHLFKYCNRETQLSIHWSFNKSKSQKLNVHSLFQYCFNKGEFSFFLWRNHYGIPNLSSCHNFLFQHLKVVNFKDNTDESLSLVNHKEYEFIFMNFKVLFRSSINHNSGNFSMTSILCIWCLRECKKYAIEWYIYIYIHPMHTEGIN